MSSCWNFSRVLRFAAANCVAVVVAFGEAQGQQAVDPEADRILKSMSSYFGSLPAFTADFDVDVEYVLRTSEKLQFSSWGKVSVKRPGSIHVARHGGFADVEMFYDGTKFTLLGKRANAYAQLEVKGTLGDAVDAVRGETGLELPGGDLFYPDVYAGLMLEVESGAYWGTTFVSGIECHYLTYRAKDIDWQIWIQVGDKPLPIKFVITNKWTTGAPQYSLRLVNWNTNPQFTAKQFEFTPPAGATKLNEFPTGVTGEIDLRR